jgi:mRNA interferase RelE/StbE
MEVDFASTFLKTLKKTKNSDLLQKIHEAIEEVICSNKLEEIKNIKKLTGYKYHYRIKVQEYRIGIEVIDNIVRFLVVLHRKDIYKKFP